MVIKGWMVGFCPLCGDEASVVFSAIHERFDDEAAVLCPCLGQNENGNANMQRLRNKQFWDAWSNDE